MKEQEYYQVMADAYTARAGFSLDEASDTAIRFHTLAEQLTLLESRLHNAYGQNFPQSAHEEALDTHAAAWGLARKTAVPASGSLRFSRTKAEKPQTIPAGTICRTADGFSYELVSPAVFTASALTADASAKAILPGPIGNALANSITVCADWPTVTNPAAFSGGMDREDDERLRIRVLDAIAQRNIGGANGAFYRQLAAAQPGISDALVTENADGGILVRVAGSGTVSVPTATLTAVSDLLNRYREPCAVVTVQAIPVTNVSLSVEAQPAVNAPADWENRLTELLSETINCLRIGQRLTLAALYRAADGITQSFRVTVPAVDQYPGPEKVLRAGPITITQTGAGV